MELVIRNFTRKKIDKIYLENVVEKTLEAVGKKNSQVSIILVGEKRIRFLNRKYRNKDKVTDVLSFGFYGSKNNIFAPNAEDMGDIFVCVKRAEEQAKQNSRRSKEEIATLVVHGILHLAGYDHENDSEARIMQSMEKNINELVRNL